MCRGCFSRFTLELSENLVYYSCRNYLYGQIMEFILRKGSSMKKRILFLALVMVMIFTLLPMSAFAVDVVAEGTCGENLTWTFDDEGVLTITGTGEMTSSPWRSYKDSIKSVVIGNGVTSIISDAFWGCTGLSEVSIPNSVTKIKSAAFWGCSSLTEITIPDSVTIIEYSAFTNCTGLTKVCLPDGITYLPSGIFYTAHRLRK